MWGIWFEESDTWFKALNNERIEYVTEMEAMHMHTHMRFEEGKDKAIVKKIPFKETPITCYGVRGKNDKDGWLMDINGVMFWTVSKAVAQARLKLCNNDKVEVAEFIEENNP